jgi:hypothetical protein
MSTFLDFAFWGLIALLCVLVSYVLLRAVRSGATGAAGLLERALQDQDKQDEHMRPD